MDCWSGAKILCDFWDTKINTDNIILTTRYRSEDIPGFVADPEEIKKYAHELVNNAHMAATDNKIRDTILINQKFDYLYAENGRLKAVVVDNNGEPQVTDVTPDKPYSQSLITDGQGDTLVVSKKGQVMGVKEYKFAGDDRHLLNEYHRQLDSLGEWQINFLPDTKHQTYAFDQLGSGDHGIFATDEYYPKSGNYDFRYKSVESGKFDRVVVDFGSYPEKDSVNFKDKYGVTLKVVDGNILSFTGVSQPDTNYIYAYRGDKKIGKLMLNVYKRKPIKVCLVMVNGAHHKESFKEIKESLDKVFLPAVVEFEILSDEIEISGLTSFSHGGSGILTVYNDDQKKVLSAYEKEKKMKDGVYYLFFIDNVTDKKDGSGTPVSGYMPRGYNAGFIYDGGSPLTIAHELGHGIGNLEHVFENSNNSGKTANLMDYASGEELWHFQWDQIQDPSRVWMKWRKEESEGENVEYDFQYFYSIFQNGLSRGYNLVLFSETINAQNDEKNQYRNYQESLIYQYGSILVDDKGLVIKLSPDGGKDEKYTSQELNNATYFELKKSVDFYKHTDFVIYKWFDGKEYICYLDKKDDNIERETDIKDHIVKQTINANYEVIKTGDKVLWAFENMSDGLLYLIGDAEIITKMEAEFVSETNRGEGLGKQVSFAIFDLIQPGLESFGGFKYDKDYLIMVVAPKLLFALAAPFLGFKTTACLDGVFISKSSEIAERVGVSTLLKYMYNLALDHKGMMEDFLASLRDEFKGFIDESIIDALSDCIIDYAVSIYPEVINNLSEEQKQKEFQEDARHTVAILLYEFATGTGEPVRNFDANSAFVKSYLSGGPNKINSEKENFVDLHREVVRNFYNEIVDNQLSYKSFLEKYKRSTLRASLEFSPSDNISLLNALDNHLYSNLAQFFIGGSVAYYYPTDKKNIVKVRISNSTSLFSLLLHITDNIPRDKTPYKKLSTIQQNFLFDITIDEQIFK